MVASMWSHNRLMVFSKSWCLFSLLGSCTSFQHGNCVTFIWFFSIFFLSVSLFSVCLAEEDVSRIETSDDGFEELKLSEEGPACRARDRSGVPSIRLTLMLS